MAYKQYQLAVGTKLDDRYIIQRVIGEGGFGITYEAMNERVHTSVAIKELYCREMVSRDCTVSNEITVTYSNQEDAFLKAKDHFLREARVIGSFAGKPGVVSVTDFFEENGTAYIVMNYLEGMTLKNYIKENGTMAVKKTYELLMPLMKTLEQIHKAGIIHRDISSDNIMVSPEGQLILLDFGSARGYFAEHDQTSTIVMKNGYTPCEQYDSTAKQGPWSDIYSLSAVIYECIVGKVPDNSLQRMMFDELRFPMELGVSMKEEEENILKKGLQLAPEQRYQNMHDLLEDIQNCYKQSEESMEAVQKTEKKKWRKWAVLGGVLSILCVGVVIGYEKFKEEISFFLKDTETFYLQPSEEISLQDYEKAMKKVEHRIQVLSGDEPYIVENTGKYLRCVIVKDVCINTNMREVLRNFISRKIELSIGGQKISREQIKSVYYKKPSTIQITLRDTASEAVKKNLESKETCSITQDASSQNALSQKIRVKSNLSFEIDAPKDEKLAELMVDNYLTEEMNTSFFFCYEIPSAWEEQDSNSEVGKYQVSESELDASTVTVEYGPYDYNRDLEKNAVTLAKMDFKQRLDALKVPYAFGTSPQTPQNFVVRMNQKDYNETLLLALPLAHSSICIQTPWEWIDSWSKEMNNRAMLKKAENGTYQFVISRKDVSESSKERIDELYQKAVDAGETELCLYVYGRKILCEDIQKACVDGDFIFSGTTLDDGVITEKNLPFFRLLLCTMNDTKLPCGYEQKVVEYVDDNGELALEASHERETGKLSEENTQWIQKKANAIVPDCEVNSRYNGQFHSVSIILGDESLSYQEEQLEQVILKLYEECKMSDGEYDAFYIKQRREKGSNDLRLMLGFNKAGAVNRKRTLFVKGVTEESNQFVMKFKKKWEGK